MSMRYKGAVISATPPTTSTTTATGVWTLPQQMQAQGAGNWPYGGPFTYIEDVFSTWLYTGTGNGSGTTGTVATITNNVDLSTNGGLVWIKNRGRVVNHGLYDTARGALNGLQSNLTSAQSAFTNTLTAFTSSGFSLGNDGSNTVNLSGDRYASWTFRKQPKFFDIVTYTGTGTTLTVPHNLGSVPGCIIIKWTSGTGYGWYVYHRDTITGNPAYSKSAVLILNSTAAASYLSGSPVDPWIDVSSTNFQILTGDGGANYVGGTFVAYLFAHNAGGFGTSGNDNVITCGSFTTDGSGTATVTLGYEPQWVIIKATAGTESWQMYDTMRGWSVKTSGAQELDANGANAEAANNAGWPTATGFFAQGQSASRTYIYIAIRRGPMKVPTVGTSVFSPVARTGTGAVATVSVGFAPDFLTTFYRTDPGQDKVVFDRLRGPTQYLATNSTSQEVNVSTNGLISFNNTSFTTNANGYANNSGSAFVNHVFGRAPGFFDEVCGTGTGAASTFTHNLGVAPELVIWKSRNGTDTWRTLSTSLAKYGSLDTTAAFTNSSIQFYFGNDTTYVAPTSTTVYLGQSAFGNGSTYVAYLFATCPGVSKVGTYTGTGATLTIDCGFTGGARFVLIKRTDSTGDWYVWDTARGMVAGTDPSLLLNSAAVEQNVNSVYTTSVGFQIVNLTNPGINASGGTYIFLAVA